jgi:DNA replication protein DnaC
VIISQHHCDEISENKFIIIDDLDTVQTTDFRSQNLKNFIYKLIDYRYNENLIIVFTTNRNYEELVSFYGGRVVDRLLGLCEIIKIEGKSKRSGLQINRTKF